MTEQSPAKHLAVVVMVLLGLFTYVGWRLRHGDKPAGDDAALATSSNDKKSETPVRPQLAPASIPVPDDAHASPAPVLEPEPAPAPSTSSETAGRSEPIGGSEPQDGGLDRRTDDRSTEELSQWLELPENTAAPTGADASPAPAPQPAVYKVVGGDSLCAIAARLLGSERDWKRIYDANRDLLKDPAQLSIGMELKIPTVAASAPALAPESAPAPVAADDGARRHVVAQADTLSAISQKYYGTVKYWPEIYDANRKQIVDANRLQPGMEIVIPKLRR